MVNATAPPATCASVPATSNGTWTGGGPIHYAVPLLILQLMLVQVIARIIHVLLSPLRQPKVISEILAGVVLGPSIMGYIPGFSDMIFPKSSFTVLNTLAFIGLVFFLFTVGCEMDLRVLRRTSKAAFTIGMAGVLLPFTIGIGVSFAAKAMLHVHPKLAPFLIFMGAAMSVTALPVLAIILAQNKLLATDVGQVAMAAATVNDVVAWTMLALALALSTTGDSIIVLYIVVCSIGFIVIMFVVVKPFMAWVGSQVNENDEVPEWVVAVTLLGLLCSGFTTDTIGIHIIFGAFLFGLIIPNDGPFPGRMIEKVDSFNQMIFLPFFFAQSGLVVKLEVINTTNGAILVFLILAVAILGKVGGTIIAALCYKIPFRKSLVLGFAMNTKGVVELIVLNIGYQRKVINEELYSIMVVMALVTTFMTSPFVMLLYKPSMSQPLTGRKVEGNDGEQLRVLFCVRGRSPSPAALNLAELFKGTKKSLYSLFFLHMLEASEKKSTAAKITGALSFRTLLGKEVDTSDADEEQPVTAESYSGLSGVRFKTLTTYSPLEILHEDVCTIAGNRLANLLILPFDPRADPVNYPRTVRRINQASPCSVGTFIQCGTAAKQVPADVVQRVLVLFFGGADDREALAVAMRISKHPGVTVSIIRFLPVNKETVIGHTLKQQQLETAAVKNNITRTSSVDVAVAIPVTRLEIDSEAEQDEVAIKKVKEIISGGKSAGDASISFDEKITEHAFEAAGNVAADGYDLVLLGKGRRPSPLLASSMEKEFSKFVALAGNGADAEKGKVLGPLGMMLADHPDLQANLLVLQQHDQAPLW